MILAAAAQLHLVCRCLHAAVAAACSSAEAAAAAGAASAGAAAGQAGEQVQLLKLQGRLQGLAAQLEPLTALLAVSLEGCSKAGAAAPPDPAGSLCGALACRAVLAVAACRGRLLQLQLQLQLADGRHGKRGKGQAGTGPGRAAADLLQSGVLCGAVTHASLERRMLLGAAGPRGGMHESSSLWGAALSADPSSMQPLLEPLQDLAGLMQGLSRAMPEVVAGSTTPAEAITEAAPGGAAVALASGSGSGRAEASGTRGGSGGSGPPALSDVLQVGAVLRGSGTAGGVGALCSLHTCVRTSADDASLGQRLLSQAKKNSLGGALSVTALHSAGGQAFVCTCRQQR